MRTRIAIDRLVLDGLPRSATPAAIEEAVRQALATRLAGAAPTRSATLPSVQLQGRAGGSIDAAAGDVAKAVATIAGGRR